MIGPPPPPPLPPPLLRLLDPDPVVLVVVVVGKVGVKVDVISLRDGVVWIGVLAYPPPPATCAICLPPFLFFRFCCGYFFVG